MPDPILALSKEIPGSVQRGSLMHLFRVRQLSERVITLVSLKKAVYKAALILSPQVPFLASWPLPSTELGGSGIE